MNKKVIIGVALSCLLLATIGFTYAFFTATVNGNENAKNQVVETGTLSLVYKDGQELKLDSAIPGSSVTKTFTVTNTGNLIADYSINLSELINTIENDELVVEGTCLSYENYDNEDKSIKDVCLDIENQVVPMSSVVGSSTIKDSISIKPGITHEYKITITFIETGDSQNYNQGKQFSSKVQINESVESNRLVDRIFRDNTIYADNVASEYVTSSTGINFSAISSDTNGKGLYSLSDKTLSEGGKDVYYFRGAVENNYVIFGEYNTDKIKYYNLSTQIDYETENECINADSAEICNKYVYHKTGDKMCWRIVRTNEDGSVKLRYGGTTDENGYCPKTGSDVRIGISAFNTNTNDNAYIGYMYGDFEENSASYEEAHENINESDIKTIIDEWYRDNISNTKYNSLIVNSIYCNDRSVISQEDMPNITSSSTQVANTGKGYGTYNTFYGSTKRFIKPTTDHPSGSWIMNDVVTPTFKCLQNNDKFTLSVSNGGESGYGNGKLTYPIGLLTADEIFFAGGNIQRMSNESENKDYYLFTSRWYWTMTPLRYILEFSYPYVLHLGGGTGTVSFNRVSYQNGGVLPAISLTPNANVSTGTGTYSDPYVIYVN